MAADRAFDIAVELRRGATPIAARFTAAPGLTALCGPSGVGKTTVLDMVAGLVRPAAGRIEVAGALLFDSASGVDLPPQARGCGYVFQDLRLFPHRTVRENLLYGQRFTQGRAALLTLDAACDLLGIGPLLARMPATLSGGEAQRVAIGRALLAAPRFLLLDEPLSAVDAPRRAEILALIARIRDQFALPILYVSHDRAEVARIAQRVIELPQAAHVWPGEASPGA